MAHKSKLARTFQSVINLRTAAKITSSNRIGNGSHGGSDVNRRGAALEALVAMVFASVTSIKAAYVELQMAQNSYNNDAIQATDQAVVEQLKVLSELKHNFVRLMMNEMEIAKWDVDAAAKSIEPGFVSHVFEVIEEEYFKEFKSLKIAQPKSFLIQNLDSSFAKLAIAKFLKLVHPIMECSFSGNLNRRKLVINGGFPDIVFLQLMQRWEGNFGYYVAWGFR
ncbi:hypothetical protein F3Y22_tig00109923pilonHSYRG00050 [Hibiscus syriacus]|uniref:DUF641 domain-containing protein n=1 Tax=Hibiscus syriacus TaxID=106335 RepID=A0A6A3BT23_HIBSY|nr:hypothetical protein F3Y22_tig00109923pilonHSYRG00050 [Hibiscus syriacus]